MTFQVFILTPRSKPQCGVSDHSHLLAEALNRDGVNVHIINLDELNKIGLKARVLVQASIYGFHPRGVPLQLVNELRRLKCAGGRFVTYFHELWVPDAPLGSSAYWLHPVQKWLCRWLALNGAASHFNSPWAYNWGQQLVEAKAVYSPTCSNVGELWQPLQLQDRPARLVCFGAPARRREAYFALLPVLKLLAITRHVTEVVDIGAEPEVMPQEVLCDMGLQVRACGRLAAERVSAELALARYGTHYTPWSLATKSGIYGALVAHGVMPVSVHECNLLPLDSGSSSADLRPLTIGVREWGRRLGGPDALIAFAGDLERARQHYKSVTQLADELLHVLCLPIQHAQRAV